MSEELTGLEGGVGIPPVADPMGATGQEPTAAPPETPTAEPPSGVNLDDLEEFRSWKSQTDRRFAQMQSQLAAEQERARKAQEERDQYEQYVTQAQMADKEPQEVAAYYQDQINKVRQEQRQAEEQRVRQAEIQGRAETYLAKVGLTADTDGLDWSGGPTYDGLISLMDSASEVLARQQQQLAKKAKAELEATTRTTRQQTLQQAGVTNVSTATGAPTPGAQQQYAAEKEKLRGSGDWTALAELNLKYRKLGVDV